MHLIKSIRRLRLAGNQVISIGYRSNIEKDCLDVKHFLFDNTLFENDSVFLVSYIRDSSPNFYYKEIQDILNKITSPRNIMSNTRDVLIEYKNDGYFFYDEFSSNNLTISHPDGINLFYNYFKAFEIYVDEYLDSSYQKKRWYKLFKQELPKLEEVYKQLVAKGDIVEVDIEKE